MSPEFAGQILAWVVIGLALLAGFHWAMATIERRGEIMRRKKRHPAHGYRPVELPLPGERRRRWWQRLENAWVTVAGALLGSGTGLLYLAVEKAGYLS